MTIPLPPCLILGGGLGSRMRPATDQVPKPLLPVAGEPFAVHQLRWLIAQGVTEVVYSTGYLGHMIREALTDRLELGCRICFVDDGEQLLGTGGAVRRALEESDLGEAFFVLYGDSYLHLDLQQVWEEFTGAGDEVDGLMTVFRNEGRWDRSNARLEGRRVVLYDKDVSDPTEAGMHHIDYGLSVLNSNAARARLPEGPSDLAHLLRSMSLDGRLAGYEATERFFEIGSPEGLAALQEHLG